MHSGELNWIVHHGRNRLKDATQLERLDLVVTTYHTLVADWRKQRGTVTHPLFTTHWHRVILDEGPSKLSMFHNFEAADADFQHTTSGTEAQRPPRLFALYKRRADGESPALRFRTRSVILQVYTKYLGYIHLTIRHASVSFCPDSPVQNGAKKAWND